MICYSYFLVGIFLLKCQCFIWYFNQPISFLIWFEIWCIARIIMHAATVGFWLFILLDGQFSTTIQLHKFNVTVHLTSFLLCSLCFWVSWTFVSYYGRDVCMIMLVVCRLVSLRFSTCYCLRIFDDLMLNDTKIFVDWMKILGLRGLYGFLPLLP